MGSSKVVTSTGWCTSLMFFILLSGNTPASIVEARKIVQGKQARQECVPLEGNCLTPLGQPARSCCGELACQPNPDDINDAICLPDGRVPVGQPQPETPTVDECDLNSDCPGSQICIMDSATCDPTTNRADGGFDDECGDPNDPIVAARLMLCQTGDDTCVDDITFRDSVGRPCALYTSAQCETSSPAQAACCFCGGGIRTTTATSVTATEDQAQLRQIEAVGKSSKKTKSKKTKKKAAKYRATRMDVFNSLSSSGKTVHRTSNSSALFLEIVVLVALLGIFVFVASRELERTPSFSEPYTPIPNESTPLKLGLSHELTNI
eukprot:m.30688 g.30688  ORF g.30688 m.30688 type:complete len:321 (+) comp8229_c0_seq2:67-1029(+)